MKTVTAVVAYLALSFAATCLAQQPVPGTYADHLDAVVRLINSDLKPAINVSQRLLNELTDANARLAADEAELTAAQKEHAEKNLAREQAWQQVVMAIQAGIGIDPGSIDYAEHMATVQSLIAAASDANQTAEAARQRLLQAQAAVQASQALASDLSKQHTDKNDLRKAEWQKVIQLIQSGL